MREEARLWWEQAQHDLKTADILLDAKRFDAASFYYEQAVEKALKAAYIVTKRETPGPTHSLTKLGRECGLPTDYGAFLRSLTTDYYVSRYPDASGDIPFDIYEVDDVRETSRLAREIVQWLEQLINKS